MKKRMTALLLSFAMCLGTAPSLGVYAAEAEPTAIYGCDFEDGTLGGWYLRNNNGSPTLESVEEDGNHFIRLTVTSNTLTSHPTAHQTEAWITNKLENAFVKNADGCTVIEMDVRASGLAFEKFFRVNYPITDEAVAEATGSSYHSLWLFPRQWNATYQACFGYTNGTATNNLWVESTNTPFVVEANKWYRVRTVFKNTNNQVAYAIYDTNGALLESDTGKNAPDWYKSTKTINSLDLNYHNTKNVSGGETLDIDNVKIYNQSASVTAALSYAEGETAFYKGDAMAVKFSAPVLLSDGAVSITDAEGNAAAAETSYSANGASLVIDMKDAPSGAYTVKFDKDKIQPQNSTEGMISSMSFSASDITFEYVASAKPKVTDVEISGDILAGETLEADYTFVHSDEQEGASIHEWWICDTFDGEYKKIDGAETSELYVESSMEGKYIKYAVTPVTQSGVKGAKTWSKNTVAPQVAPYAKNVEIKGNNWVGGQMKGSYTYVDANGDDEYGTAYQWYISETKTSGYTPITGAEGLYYKAEEQDKGKYVKFGVTPAAEKPPYTDGQEYFSDPVEIGDVLEVSNLLKNSGAENGLTDGWGISYWESRADDAGVYLKTDISHSGKNSVLIAGRRTTMHQWTTPSFKAEAGKRYIIGGWVRPVGEKMEKVLATFAGSGVESTMTYRNDEETSCPADEWTQVLFTHDVSESTQAKGFYLISYSSYPDYYVDDVYAAEVMVGDIDTDILLDGKAVDSVTIPESGSVKLDLKIGSVLNQLGTKHGVYDETAAWKIEELPQGVSYNKETAQLTVSDNAVAGTVELKAVCKPSFSDEEFVKAVPFKLDINSKTEPKITDLVVKGTTEQGSTLTGSYDYYQVGGSADASTYRWLYSETEDGTYTEIPGAVKLTYKVEADYADKFIRLEVSPKAKNGETSTAVLSNVCTVATAPTVDGKPTIEGKMFVGEKLTGVYTFFDKNMDEEKGSTYRWLVSDTEDGAYTAISGAVGTEYTLTSAEANKFIKFEVTPKADAEPNSTRAYTSDPIPGPQSPKAENVSIAVDGVKLTGSYTYSQAYGIGEGKSKYKWYIDGAVVSESIYMLCSFTGTKQITFEVTPVAQKEPYEGTPVSVTKSVTIGSSGGGGGSHGGSGGSGTSYARPADTVFINLTAADLEKHWSAEYGKRMLNKHIMTLDENNNFNPDEDITRRDMAVFLFNALKLEKKAYSGEFSDVAEQDSLAGILQALVDAGIISHDTAFRPDDNITREELCKVLYVALKNNNKHETENSVELSSFADSAAVAEWAVPYVKGVLDLKLMVGTGENEFSPKMKSTKAQIAAVLSRLLDLLGE